MQYQISSPDQVGFSNYQKLILALLTFLGGVIRFYNIGKESIWFDEALSMYFSHQPLSISIGQMLEEGLHHTPFYYLLLRPFMYFSYTEISARTLSAILGILAIPLLGYLGKALISPRVGLTAAALLTINPFHVWYSRETRMYALMALVSIVAMYFFSANTLRKPATRNWIGLALIIAVGVNTHHFAYYLILCQFVFIILTFKTNYKVLRPWVATIFIAALSLLPWIVIVIGRGNFYGSGSATEIVQWDEPFKTLWNFSSGYTVEVNPLVIVSLVLTSLVILWGLKPRRSLPELYITISLLLPPLLTFMLSLRLPMYVDRYLIVSLPAFILALAIGLQRARPVWLAVGATTVIVAAMLLGLWRIYFDNNIYERADWRSAAGFISQEIDPDRDVLITLNYVDIVPFTYYFKEDVPVHPLKVSSNVHLPDLDEHILNTAHSKIFLIIPHPNQSTHLIGHCQPLDPTNYPPETEIRSWMASIQNKLVETLEFPCINVAIFQY